MSETDLDNLLNELNVESSRTSMASASRNSQLPAASRASYTIQGADGLDDLMASLETASSRASVASRQSTAPQHATPQMVQYTQPPQYAPPQRGSVAYVAPASKQSVDTSDLDDLVNSLSETSSVRFSVAPQYRAPAAQAPPAGAPQNQSIDDLIAGLEGPSSALSFPPASAAAQPKSVAKPAAKPQANQAGYRGTMGQLDDILSALAVPEEEQKNTRSAPPPARAAPVSNAAVDSLVADLTSKLGAPDTRGNCGMCNREIIGDCVQAMGKKFHVDHWVCMSCQVPLMTTEWFDRQGSATCKKCMQSLHAPRCAACGESIMDRCVTALGKKWHVHHFVCTTCKQPFSGQYFTREGMPYCDLHAR